MSDNKGDEILEFFKALADANRLKIVGLLATDEYSVEQLAGMLNLSASTVSHHLQMLAHVGLVGSRSDSYYSIYYLDVEALNDMASRLLSHEAISDAFIKDVDLDGYDRKVMETYLAEDGTIRQIPSQQKKLEVILRYLLREFEPGRKYQEVEVNEVIKRFNADVSGLRRDLIDFKLLSRDNRGSCYWVTGSLQDS